MAKSHRFNKVAFSVIGLVVISGGLARSVQPTAVELWSRVVAPAGEITIVPTEIPAISAFSLDAPRVDTKFLDMFDSMGQDWAYFRPYGVVLSNQSEQGIDALALAWTTTNAAGKSTTTYTVWEGYFNLSRAGGPGARGGARAGNRAATANSARGGTFGGGAAGNGGEQPGQRGAQRGGARGPGRGGAGGPTSSILASQAQLLVVPTRCPNANLCGFTDGSAGSIAAGLVGMTQLRAPDKTFIAELKNAARVSVEIDLVIFANGQVWGPDRARAIPTIQTRQAAIEAFVARAKAIVAEDGDLDAFLTQLAASKATPQTDLSGFFTANQARFLNQNNAPRQTLQSIESVPPLPAFTRGQLQ